MKNIILFDTSVGSLNQGDNIIMKAVREGMDYILGESFVVTMPTHNPAFLASQEKDDNVRFSYVDNADHKFICGTNILNGRMKSRYPNWNVYDRNCKAYIGSVLIGAGSSSFSSETKFDKYTEKLLKKMLSDKYIHSTRDDRTCRILNNMGISAVNTGCPTTWYLTEDFCKTIPKKKADNVVFTLTDYLPNKNDQLLVDKLINLYDHVYFWPQGSKDHRYFMTLNNTDRVEIVPPNIWAYDRLLSKGNLDYIGTRLHGGIFAMQHKVRSYIIGVDNRAKDMTETHNINYISRDEVENAEAILSAEKETKINIPEESIRNWKEQFVK